MKKSSSGCFLRGASGCTGRGEKSQVPGWLPKAQGWPLAGAEAPLGRIFFSLSFQCLTRNSRSPSFSSSCVLARSLSLPKLTSSAGPAPSFLAPMLVSDPRSGDTGGDGGGGGRRRALSFLPVFAAGNFGRERARGDGGVFPKSFAFVRNAAVDRPSPRATFFCKSPFSESEVFLRRCRARSFASFNSEESFGGAR